MLVQRALILAACLLLAASLASAGPGYMTYDYRYAAGYYYGDGTERIFEIWELGSRIDSGKLYFTILMDLPESGAYAVDSYQKSPKPLLSPGDLWISVGSRDPFEPGYPRYAVALTTHDNVVQQKYPGQLWRTVTKGDLYTDALFSTGTYETYQRDLKPSKPWLGPDDQDGDDTKNSYMGLIRGFSQEITGHSSVTWGPPEPYWFYDPGIDDWVLVDSWRVTGYADLSQIGLTEGMPYSLFISSECGNDGAENGPPVAEPAALFILALGAASIRRRPR